MKNWIITMLGGVTPEQQKIASLSAYSHGRSESPLNEEAIKRLIDHAISGVFYNLHNLNASKKPKRRRKCGNITEAELAQKILKHQKP